jgi:hypothetical protein
MYLMQNAETINRLVKQGEFLLKTFCFWQVGLAHFGGLIWPTPRDVKVERTEFRSAGA